MPTTTRGRNAETNHNGSPAETLVKEEIGLTGMSGRKLESLAGNTPLAEFLVAIAQDYERARIGEIGDTETQLVTDASEQPIAILSGDPADDSPQGRADEPITTARLNWLEVTMTEEQRSTLRGIAKRTRETVSEMILHAAQHHETLKGFRSRRLRPRKVERPAR